MHAVTRVDASAHAGGRHIVDGKRCWSHGHCADCGAPVVMNKYGKYVHKADYRAARKRSPA
jgi:hypothetical protein